MLIQIDGSHHGWLGGNGPQFTLLLAVDDATGMVVNALFFNPNPPMGGVRAGQNGMREPTREKAWAPLGPM